MRLKLHMDVVCGKKFQRKSEEAERAGDKSGGFARVPELNCKTASRAWVQICFEANEIYEGEEMRHTQRGKRWRGVIAEKVLQLSHNNIT